MHIAILGAYGSAGAAAARELQSHVGEEITRLTLLDSGDPGGGLCILRGCMPSKALLSPAKTAHKARHDTRVNEAGAQIDVQKTVEHKSTHVLSFAEHRRDSVHALTETDGIEFRNQGARFSEGESLVLDDGTELHPDYTLVATGSSPFVPDIAGIDTVDYQTSADVLNMETLPDSAVVLGFGAVGLEMSAYLAACGVDVSVIERKKRPLRQASTEHGDTLVDMYRDEFEIDVLTEHSTAHVEQRSDGVVVGVEDSSGDVRNLETDELCVFTGRSPNTGTVSLSSLGVNPRQNWVNDDMSVKGTDTVFAAGDVTGTRMILHMAKDEGQIAARNFLDDAQDNQLETYDPIHHQVLFTGVGKYPYAVVGETADDGRQEDGLITVSRKPSDDGIFTLKDAQRGHAALVVDAETGVIKGYEGVHLHADVMAKTAQVLVRGEQTVQDTPQTAYHPTTPELFDGLLRAAEHVVNK